MKTNPIRRCFACLSLAAISIAPAPAQEPPLRDLLRDGLYAEEVTRDPEAAAKHYEQVLARYSEQRAFAASALFRLAEVRRKQERKEDAVKLYQQLLAEFPGAATETKLARENLAALGGKLPEAKSAPVDHEAVELDRLRAAATSAPDVLLAPYELESASIRGFSKVVKLLLAAGGPRYESQALQNAAQTGNLEIIKLLLADGGPVPAKVATEALMRAVGQRRYTTLEFLLKSGLRPELRDDGYGLLPLLANTVLTNDGAYQAVEILLKNGADIDEMAARPSQTEFVPNGTALAMSVLNGKFGSAVWLLEKGAKPDLPDPTYGLSPLHYAAMAQFPGTLEMMEKLLAAGADPNRVSVERQANTDLHSNTTPLETAIASGSMALEKTRLLLKHGANPNRKDSRVTSMLVFAIKGDDPNVLELVQLLGEAGFSMASPELLKAALLPIKPKLVEALLKHGADPNLLTFDPELSPGDSLPLISIACLKGDFAMLNALLAAGADLKAAGQELIQRTAVSSKGDTIKCLMLLAAAGAVPDEEWRKSGYRGAGRDAMRYLIERFRIPELVGGPDINLLIDMVVSIRTSRIAEPSDDPQPPELVSWLLANGEKVQLPITGGGRSYQWSIMRKGEGGAPIRKTVDFFADATIPELRWGDLIVCEPISKAGAIVEFRNGLPDDLVWSLRKRISFPITVEIEGTTRKIQLRGDLLAYDPTKPEMPLASAREVVNFLMPKPNIMELDRGSIVDGRVVNETNIQNMIVIFREGWPEVRLAYHSEESGNFQLKTGDRVRLDMSDVLRQTFASSLRNVVVVRLADYPFHRAFAAPNGGKPADPTIPSLIQALVDIQLPVNSSWADLAGKTTFDPGVLLKEGYFKQFTLFPHPDLSQIRIHRANEDGGKKQIDVDLAKAILASTDALTPQEARKSDVFLQAGDLVEIPVLVKSLDTPWKGFSPRENAFFAKALAGRLQVADENGNITVRDIDYGAPRFIEAGASWIPVAPVSGVASVRAWWQAPGRIGALQRGGDSFGPSDSSASFLRDGDAIRLRNSIAPPRQPRSSSGSLPSSR